MSLGEPNHTLVPCWMMTVALLPTNECLGCFPPTFFSGGGEVKKCRKDDNKKEDVANVNWEVRELCGLGGLVHWRILAFWTIWGFKLF